jgi:hypothetical protein
LDGPSQPEAVFDNRHLGERLEIIHQWRKMYAASDQPRQIEFAFAPISGKANAQDTVAGCTHLCHSRHVVAHADHLWNSSDSSNSSA